MAFAVWGGDPVYPTVNYIQDPDEVIDYRGPDFHEPTPNMLSFLKEVSTFQIPCLFLFWNIMKSFMARLSHCSSLFTHSQLSWIFSSHMLNLTSFFSLFIIWLAGFFSSICCIIFFTQVFCSLISMEKSYQGRRLRKFCQKRRPESLR